MWTHKPTKLGGDPRNTHPLGPKAQNCAKIQFWCDTAGYRSGVGLVVGEAWVDSVCDYSHNCCFERNRHAAKSRLVCFVALSEFGLLYMYGSDRTIKILYWGTKNFQLPRKTSSQLLKERTKEEMATGTKWMHKHKRAWLDIRLVLWGDEVYSEDGGTKDISSQLKNLKTVLKVRKAYNYETVRSTKTRQWKGWSASRSGLRERKRRCTLG